MGRVTRDEAGELLRATLKELQLRRGWSGGVPAAALANEFLQNSDTAIHKELGFSRFTDFVAAIAPDIRIVRHGLLVYFLHPLEDGPVAVPRTQSLVIASSSGVDFKVPDGLLHWLSVCLSGLPDDSAIVSDDHKPGLRALSEGDYAQADRLLHTLAAQICRIATNSRISNDVVEVLLGAIRARAHVLAVKGLCETAADVFLSGMWLARDAGIRYEKPSHYLRYVAAGHEGSALLTEPLSSSVFRSGDSDLVHSLSVACARLHHFEPGTEREALENEAPTTFYTLRDSLRDTVLRKILPSGKPSREQEYKAFELAASAFKSARRDAEAACRELLSCTVDNVRHYSTSLLQAMGKLRPLLLPHEQQAWQQAQHLLTAQLSKFISDIGSASVLQPNVVERAQTYGDQLARFAEDRFLGSYIIGGIVVPAVRGIHLIVRQSMSSAISSLEPTLQLRRATRRYPIAVADATFTLPLEIRNTGNGPANDILVRLTAREIEDEEASATLQSLAAGESATLSIDLTLARPQQTLRMDVSVQCLSFMGTPTVVEDEIVLDAQMDEPDWQTLLSQKPYALNPVENTERLWGRDSQLEAIRLHIARGTSCIVWGQKRVGKTSVARVLFNELQAKPDVLSLYFRKGDLAGFHEGEIAAEVADRLTTLAEKRALILGSGPRWSAEWYGTRLTRLTRALDALRDAGVKSRIVLFFDEFDEIGRFVYDSERGEDFFGTMRALSERDVVFVLVGSERMPAVFQLYGSLLNKCETLRLDTIDRQADLVQLIVEPVRGFIEFDNDAQNQISLLSGGNPYYVNILCSRLLHLMVTSRRTYVDIVDVQRAAAELARDASPTNWSHLWEDSESYHPASRAQNQKNFLMVLSAFERRPAEVSLRAEQITAFIKAEFSGELQNSHQVDDTLFHLVRRRVLESKGGENGAAYQARPLMFRSWLIENGRTRLVAMAREPARTPEPETENPLIEVTSDFPLTDEELLPIADGLQYRGRHIDAMTIKLWLKQFKGNQRILMAYKLISAMRKHWFVDESLRGLLLEKTYERLVGLSEELSIPLARASEERLPSGKSDYVRNVERFRGELTNVFVAYLGDALKSSPECVRDFRKMMRVRNAGPLANVSAWMQGNPDRSFVIVIDDFVGSGYQAAKAFRAWRKASKDDVAISRALSESRVMFVPLLAYKIGLLEVQDALPDLRLCPMRLLSEDDTAFSQNSPVFDTDEQRLQAQAMCEEIGSQLWADHPLGWERLQSLVVFSTAVPNGTLPVIWKDGVVDGQVWRSLFPR
ncbi:MAG: hypothetical protein AB7T06_07775 [Kofleriaceae bacterium]